MARYMPRGWMNRDRPLSTSAKNVARMKLSKVLFHVHFKLLHAHVLSQQKTASKQIKTLKSFNRVRDAHTKY